MPILPAILGGVSLLGSLFGKGAQKSAEGRAKEAELVEARNRTLSDNYATQQRAILEALGLQSRNDLDRAQFNIAAPSSRMKQVMLGDLLSNRAGTRSSVSHPRANVVSFSTALDKLGPASQLGGADLTRDALMAMLGDTDTPKGLDFQGGVMQQPTLQGWPKPSKWEKLGGILGLVGSAAGGLGGMLPQGQSAATTSAISNIGSLIDPNKLGGSNPRLFG